MSCLYSTVLGMSVISPLLILSAISVRLPGAIGTAGPNGPKTGSASEADHRLDVEGVHRHVLPRELLEDRIVHALEGSARLILRPLTVIARLHSDGKPSPCEHGKGNYSQEYFLICAHGLSGTSGECAFSPAYRQMPTPFPWSPSGRSSRRGATR